MRLDVISDLHLTHLRDHGADFVASWIPEGEVLIIAGDLADFHWWLMGLDKLRTLCEKYQHVLFVAGNHEYYGTNLEAGDVRFREIATKIENFHFLERTQLEIGGVTFAGASLWFRDTSENARYARYLNDFRLIQGFVPAVYQRNQQDRAFLESLEDTQVVITHHMPTVRSVHRKYASEPTTLFFLCEMDHVIERLQPKLWIHGHTHVRFDYEIGKTRMLCHPMGYPKENPGPYRQAIAEI